MGSFWDKVKSIEHTVTGWLVKSYQAIYKTAPTLTKAMDVARPYVGGILQIVAQKEGISASTASEVLNVFDQVDSNLHTASALLYDAGPNPQAANLLATAAANLQTLLDAGHIKNADSQALVTKAIQSVNALVNPASGSEPTPQPVQ